MARREPGQEEEDARGGAPRQVAAEERWQLQQQEGAGGRGGGSGQGMAAAMEPSLPHDAAARQLYPVSLVWQPPFTMLVDLVGHGDPQVRQRSKNSLLRCAGPLHGDLLPQLAVGALQLLYRY
jgi:hypothetical protein